MRRTSELAQLLLETTITGGDSQAVHPTRMAETNIIFACITEAVNSILSCGVWLHGRKQNLGIQYSWSYQIFHPCTPRGPQRHERLHLFILGLVLWLLFSKYGNFKDGERKVITLGTLYGTLLADC